MFQKKIIEKYLSKIDRQLLEEKYKLYSSIFLKEAKQKNIRESKEEQYQEGFIRDLFVTVLGYTIKPEENYNIFTEAKNETKNKNNSKKSDGAICEENDENKIRAVIELKGTDTTDLDKVAFQAFSYKNHHENCNYVIVSNFERLRVYVETQIEFVEFNLFRLEKSEFDLLYLLLELSQIKNDIPLKLKHETLSEEKQITDNFYADYSTFKRLLFEDLANNNAGIDKLLLFKKTQKLLDRLLFVLFCEDRNLLPANTVKGIINDWQNFKKMGYYQPLYNLYKTFFDKINNGFENPDNPDTNVFAYNGGLFKPDEILDSVKVGDDVLYIHCQRLADYDFESQISVDILGRIFENSLTEIEEMQSTLSAPSYELQDTSYKNSNNSKLVPSNSAKAVGKRKKDGVFYTPAYITKYIVENTIGKLCEEKRAELNINDDEFNCQKKYKKDKLDELNKRLTDYREWLFSLKILDPACGSGAFLNAALHQLKTEHTLVDYYFSNINHAELNFESIDNDNSILEKNIFGVDINEESVEIAKLSLWLHTAKRGRKLTTLNDNIKCGNSLIGNRDEGKGTRDEGRDCHAEQSTCHAELVSASLANSEQTLKQVQGDTTYAHGDTLKAFDWQKEFPQVFAAGGFDVVIGNPPYVQLQSMGTMSDVYAGCGYESYNKSADIYCLFTERGYQLLKKDGLLSFIMPNKWMLVDYGKELRRFLAKTSLQQIINFGDVQFFQDAATIVCIFVTRKSETKNKVMALSLNQKTYHGDFLHEVPNGLQEFPHEIFNEDAWQIKDNRISNIFEKMKNIGVPLKDLNIEINYGVKTGYNDAFFIDEETKNKLIAEDAKSAELIKPLLRGRDISAWNSSIENQYLIGTFPALELDIENYPAIKKYLLSFGKERLEQSGAKGSRKKTSNDWFETQDQISYYKEFSKPKIIYPNMTSVFPFAYDDKKYFGNDKTFIITAKDNSVSLKALTAVFNSKLCKLWIWYNCPELLGGTREIRKTYFENFCVPLPRTENCHTDSELLRNSNVEENQIPLDRVSVGNSNPCDINSDFSIFNSQLSVLSDKMLALNADLQKKTHNFLKVVKQTFGLEKVSAKLENFYELDFDGFIKELKQKVSPKVKMEWLEVFEETQKELASLKAQIEATDSAINSLVYELYELTAEEIAVIENS